MSPMSAAVGAAFRTTAPFVMFSMQSLPSKNLVDRCTGYNYNIIMDSLRFEWDPEKNEINKRKHQVSFEEAQTVFYDEEAKVIDDPEHSADEERFIILGFSKRANLLVVCHCYRASETVIRIISARKATKTEMRQYFC